MQNNILLYYYRTPYSCIVTSLTSAFIYTAYIIVPAPPKKKPSYFFGGAGNETRRSLRRGCLCKHIRAYSGAKSALLGHRKGAIQAMFVMKTKLSVVRIMLFAGEVHLFLWAVLFNKALGTCELFAV